jgi:predicted enzyme related to lactoylglutathione lyase
LRESAGARRVLEPDVGGAAIDSVLGEPPHYVNLASPPDPPGGPTLAFQRVPESKALKNRLHLDISVDDVDSATAQVEALGGRRAPSEDFTEYGSRWRVMSDPDGNEFCLVYT